MTPIIIYPLPFDAWAEFERYADRFTSTFKQFAPGNDYEIWAVCNLGLPTDRVREMFSGLNTVFIEYSGRGCDIGSAQHCSRMIRGSRFMVMMTSRCYFAKTGWLKRYTEARLRHGPGLYGASMSYEGSSTPYVCHRASAIDSDVFAQYPHDITTREHGQRFEVGDWQLSRWVTDCMKLPLWQVNWSGEYGPHNFRTPDNCFRKGDQSDCIVMDKHTDAYANADQDGKTRLAQMADGPSL